MSRRYLALALPDLTLDRLRRQHPALAGQPFAAWASRGPRRWLTAVAAPGLQPGQAVADAQAIHPGLLLFEASPAADAALLTRLALWAMRFTPLAAVDGTDGLMLDVTGVAGLFGGEAALLAAVERSFAAGGYRVRGAIAGAPGTAAALARTAGAPCLLPGEAGPEILAALPLAALRLPPATLQGRPGSACTAWAMRCASRARRWPAASAAPCWMRWTMPPAPARGRSTPSAHCPTSWRCATCWSPSPPARPSTGCWPCCSTSSARRWPPPARAPASGCCAPSGWTGRCRSWRSAPAPPRTARRIWRASSLSNSTG
ncbi:Y-family DNA polymerase [Teichococcus aestuarii]|uniref:Y-family DNA polymerase n=1 Tax=Teichococcus aestuarii TaxID=568898 RepID=UPI00361BFA0B